MPELPEIEVLKDEVNRNLAKREVVEAEVFDQRAINLPADEFRKNLLDTVLVGADRRGKMLVLSLSSGDHLLIHLMLFGQIILAKEAKDVQVAFGFDNQIWLTFSRLALGAGVYLYHEDVDKIPRVARLGIDALSLTQDEFKEIVSSRKGKIKALLMNQELIAGIGNTYADELLFRARIHPERTAKSLKEGDLASIYKHIKGVLKEAISKGGTLSDEFTHLDGSRGEFISQVHGRKGEPCPTCKTKIRKTKVGGRGTSYCPECQNYFVR